MREREKKKRNKFCKEKSFVILGRASSFEQKKQKRLRYNFFSLSLPKGKRRCEEGLFIFIFTLFDFGFQGRVI